MRRSLLVQSLAIALVAAQVTHAATSVLWDGDTDTNFLNGANWVGGSAPNNNLIDHIADFSGSFTFQPSLAVNNGQSMAGIATGSSAVTMNNTYGGVGDNQIYIGASGITTGSGAFTANFTSTRFMISASQTWNIGSGGMDWNALNASGQFQFTSTSFTFTKNGSGTLDLRDAADNFAQTGKFRFEGGTFLVAREAQLGASPASFVADKYLFDGGGRLRLAPGIGIVQWNQPNRGITVAAGGGAIEVVSAGSSADEVNMPITGAGNLTIRIASNTANPALFVKNDNTGLTGTLTLAGDGTLRSDFNGGTTSINSYAPNGGLHIDGTTGTLGTLLIFHGANTYNVGSLSSSGIAGIRAQGGGSPTVSINQTSDTTYGGVFNDTDDAGAIRLSVIKSGPGNLKLAADSSAKWTKGGAGSSMTINAGTLTVAANNALGNSSIAVSVNNGGKLASDTTGRSIGNTVTTGGTGAVLDPTGAFTIGALNAAAGARFIMDASKSDLLNITGSFTKPSASGGMNFYFFNMSPFVTYDLIDFITNPGLVEPDLVVLNAGWVLNTSFGTGALAGSGWNVTGGQVLQVQFSQVPEPAGAAILLAMAITLACGRRHRSNDPGCT